MWSGLQVIGLIKSSVIWMVWHFSRYHLVMFLWSVQQDEGILKYNEDHVIETITRPTKILGKSFGCDHIIIERQASHTSCHTSCHASCHSCQDVITLKWRDKRVMLLLAKNRKVFALIRSSFALFEHWNRKIEMM